MTETKDVLTRHEVIGLLEDATFAAKQHWGNNCYLAEQLSMLAYRIAQGEAGFVEDRGEGVFVGTEMGVEEITKSLLEMFGKTTTEVVGFHFEKSELVGLNEDKPEHYIKLSVAHQPNGKQTSEEKGEEGESEQKQPRSKPEGIERPSDNELRTSLRDMTDDELRTLRDMTDDEVRALLRDMVDNPTYDANNPTHKKVKNTTETLIDGLQKGILALNLMVEPLSEESGGRE